MMHNDFYRTLNDLVFIQAICYLPAYFFKQRQLFCAAYFCIVELRLEDCQRNLPGGLFSKGDLLGCEWMLLIKSNNCCPKLPVICNQRQCQRRTTGDIGRQLGIHIRRVQDILYRQSTSFAQYGGSQCVLARIQLHARIGVAVLAVSSSRNHLLPCLVPERNESTI